MGAGLGSIFKYLSREDKELVYNNASSNTMFSRGLSYGIGSCIINYSNDYFINEVLSLSIKRDNYFALGLGKVIGNIFSYFDGALKKDLVLCLAREKVKDNKWEKDNNNNPGGGFAMDLGIGFGERFYKHLIWPPNQKICLAIFTWHWPWHRPWQKF